MKIATSMRVRFRAVECYQRGGKTYARRGRSAGVWSAWDKNLVLDAGLNSLAQKAGGAGASYPASAFAYCQCGSGSNANSVAGNTTTFSQTGTTITASTSFFTAGMVGALIKYGATGTSNGAEQYIVSQTGTACVVAGAGMTVAPLSPATVWLVNQTALQTAAYATNTYQTSGTSNSTTFSGAQVTWQRTFNFPLQGSSFNVNEIGWSPVASLSNTLGRLLTGSTITVSTSQFLQVQLQLICTYAPASPASVPNVGTGINTAGNFMLECLQVGTVGSNGFQTAATSLSIDASYSANLLLQLRIGSTYTQNSTPAAANSFLSWTAPTTLAAAGSSAWTYVAASVGAMSASYPTAVISTAGQTCYAIALGVNYSSIVMSLLFTTPFTLPTGSFQPQPVWQCVYGRVLVN